MRTRSARRSFAAGAALGKIVACQRGVNARVDKGFNVFSGGAVGMILYNPVKQDVETDNHWLPAIHLDGPNTALHDLHHRPTRTCGRPGRRGPRSRDIADMMAAFSSRGPLGDWIKPDVTAPGVQVLAGMTPQPTGTVNGPPGNLYQAIAGTSMSSPHAAGVSALVKAAHPSWTPAEIKSALMTSSVQAVVKEDGVTPATPFDRGAGSIRANRAVNPTLVFDETYADFVAAGTDPFHRIDLNLASVDAPTMTGQITTSRTALNVTGQNQVVQGRTPWLRPGASIKVGTDNGNLHGQGRRDADLPDHDQRAVPSERAVLRANHARPAEAGANAVTMPGRVHQAAGRGDAQPHVYADSRSLRAQARTAPSARRTSRRWRRTRA